MKAELLEPKLVLCYAVCPFLLVLGQHAEPAPGKVDVICQAALRVIPLGNAATGLTKTISRTLWPAQVSCSAVVSEACVFFGRLAEWTSFNKKSASFWMVGEIRVLLRYTLLLGLPRMELTCKTAATSDQVTISSLLVPLDSQATQMRPPGSSGCKYLYILLKISSFCMPLGTVEAVHNVSASATDLPR